MPNVSPSGRDLSMVAQALLKAAEELGFNPNVVQTHGDGVYGMGFRAPIEVVETFHLFMDESHDPIHVEVPAAETLKADSDFRFGADEPQASVELPDSVLDKLLDDPEKVEEQLKAQEPQAEPPAKRGPGRPKNADKEAS